MVCFSLDVPFGITLVGLLSKILCCNVSSIAMLAWNVRGLGNKDIIRALKNFVFKFNPCIIFLRETKQKTRYLEKIRMKMKYDNAHYVELIGIVRGYCYGGRMIMELPIKGGTFTWSNQRSDDDAILEKLDQIMSSLEWSEMLPRALGVLDVAVAY
ncbi:hypothetical protein GQ457_04G021630 [Hibiscus cannabinus]